MDPTCRPSWPLRRNRPAVDRLLTSLVLGAAILLLSLAFGTRASAQTGEADPPGRVARLSDIEGTAWLYHPDAGDWVQATPNLPLTTGDILATEGGARTELQIGSTTLRLDAGSELEVAALDDSRLSFRLRAGALSIRVRNPAESGPVDVVTDDGRFAVLGAGRYRVDRGSAASFVAVDAGQVRYEYASSALTVSAGQRAEFWIDASGTAQYSLGGLAYDAFTAWNTERDRAAERASVAARYVSPEMTGVEDLDRYGSWEPNPDYGAVWIPTAVSADWAPYSAGRWVWVRPWGWTWVDDAPWGFAPFHYGRWVNLRNRWCWTPGVRGPRPVYAPALVGWVAPPRRGVSIGGGIGPAVGWFPLAPREVFVPGYRSSPGYARAINTPYVRRGDPSIEVVLRNPLAPREFENRRWPRAVTVVPATAFGDRRSLAPVAAQYRDAPWTREFARPNGPAPALLAPPVAAPPSLPNRQADGRPVRPPPGFPERRAGDPRREPSPALAGAQGGSVGAPPPPSGVDPRERYGRPDRAEPMPGNTERPRGVPAEAGAVRPFPVRPGAPGGTGLPGAAGTPQPLAPPAVSMPAQRPNPAPQASPPTAPPEPVVPRPRPAPTEGQEPGRGRIGSGSADAQEQAPARQFPGSADAQGPGRVRPFPVNRGDRRENDGRFGEGSRPALPPPRSEAPLGPAPAVAHPAAPTTASPPATPPPPQPAAPPSAQRPQPQSQPQPQPQPEQQPQQLQQHQQHQQQPQQHQPAPAAVAPPAAPRPAEAPGPARRVEGQRPAGEPQRPAVAPERRGDPNQSR